MRLSKAQQALTEFDQKRASLVNKEKAPSTIAGIEIEQ